MMRLAELIAQFKPELLERHGQRLLPSQRPGLVAPARGLRAADEI